MNTVTDIKFPATKYDDSPYYQHFGGMYLFHVAWLRGEIVSKELGDGHHMIPIQDLISPRALAYVVARLNGINIPESYYG
jgi:hypothetical protein